MNGYVITEKNFAQIAGKITKFFNHKSFEEWHSFRGGMQKRNIPHPEYIRYNRYCDLKHNHQFYKDVEVAVNNNRHRIHIYLNRDEAMLVRIGNVIDFRGNRVTIRTNWDDPTNGNRYLYQTFQINK